MKKFFILFFAISINFAFGKDLKDIERPSGSYVEQLPEFYLGTDYFRSKLKEEILKDKIKVKEHTKLEIKLTINATGKLIEVEVLGKNKKLQDKMVNAIHRIENKWKEGMINGIKKSSVLYYSVHISPNNEINVFRLDGYVVWK